MPTPPISKADAKRTVKAVNDALRKGFRPPGVPGKDLGALVTAFRSIGISPTGAHTRLRRIKDLHGIEPDWSLYKSPVTYKEIQAKKPVVRIKYTTPQTIGGPVHRGVLIGDTHDSPDIPDKSRFVWFGRHCAAVKPDFAAQMGDWGTFDSCSQHEPNYSIRGKNKPSFKEDRDSLEESLDAFDKGAVGFNGRRHFIKGNHENRVPQFEDENPETEGLMASSIDQVFKRHGWTITEYGEFLFIGGVGLTHCPMTQMGKPYGGKNPETQIANDATFDIIYAHTHKDRNHKAPKIGPQNYVRVLNVGCALPYGHVEHYALRSTTGWSYGIYNVTIQGGHIQAWEFIDMLELGRRYG